MVGIPGTNSNKCLYGNPNGEKTLILFGDSHAMQYFPTVDELAEIHDWRLIVLTKAECPPEELEVRSHGRRPRVLAVRRMARRGVRTDRRRRQER